jgi:signal transduction histidine kinase
LPKANFELAALAPIIEDLSRFIREELRSRGIDLVVSVSNGLPAVRLDPGQIRQALLNLIRNAADAMPDGGTITVQAGLLDQWAEGRKQKAESGRQDDATGLPSAGCRVPPGWPSVFIEVRDIGMGIPAENVGEIFEPFFTTKEGGTGLGLAIARQIVVDHGGSLTCESAPGVGTTFRLVLPVFDGGSS